MNSVTNLRGALELSSRAGLELDMLTAAAPIHRWKKLADDFIVMAHAHQEPPPHGSNGGASGLPWTTWLMLGGRGAGKTRLGAEWVRAPTLIASTPGRA